MAFSTKKDGSGVALSNDELKLIARSIDAGTEFNLTISPFDGLPPAVKDEASKQGYQPNDVVAVFHQGTVYLVEGNIHSRAEAEEAVFHELYHQCLRGMMGDARVTELNDVFDNLGALAGLRTLAVEYDYRIMAEVNSAYAKRGELAGEYEIRQIGSRRLVRLVFR